MILLDGLVMFGLVLLAGVALGIGFCLGVRVFTWFSPVRLVLGKDAGGDE